MAWLGRIHQAFYTTTFEKDEWRLMESSDYMGRIPQQGTLGRPGLDCGFFTLTFAMEMSLGKREFDFEQNDIPAIRNWMAHAIVNYGKVNDSDDLGKMSGPENDTFTTPPHTSLGTSVTPAGSQKLPVTGLHDLLREAGNVKIGKGGHGPHGSSKPPEPKAANQQTTHTFGVPRHGRPEKTTDNMTFNECLQHLCDRAPDPTASKAVPEVAGHSIVQQSASDVKKTSRIFALGNATCHPSPRAPPSPDNWEVGGQRLRTRDVTSSRLSTYIGDREVVSLSSLKTKAVTEEFVTVGVVVSKKTVLGQDGNYAIWTLSDLKGSEVMIFLFDNAYQAMWQAHKSIVVMISSPTYKREQTDETQPVYWMNAAHQVVRLGLSADYGMCTKLRKDGEACGNYVNAATSSCCIWHTRSGNGQHAMKRNPGVSRVSVCPISIST